MARTRNQGSKWIRKDKRLAIYLRDGGKCAYCDRTVAMGAVLTLDHIVACERGGPNDATNLVTCCRSCNSTKRDLTTRAWFKMLREAGRDTNKIGRAVRRSAAKDLTPYRRHAARLIDSFGGEATTTACILELAK